MNEVVSLISDYSGIILGIIIPVIVFILCQIFKGNKEFHKILKTYPNIKDSILNDKNFIQNNNIILNLTDDKDKQISFIIKKYSKDFDDYLLKYEKELDDFQVKIEKFNIKSVKFKRKLIKIYIDEIIRLLNNKSAFITYDITIENVSTNPQIKHNISSKSKMWTSFNYINTLNYLQDEKEKDKLYLCKKLNF